MTVILSDRSFCFASLIKGFKNGGGSGVASGGAACFPEFLIAAAGTSDKVLMAYG